MIIFNKRFFLICLCLVSLFGNITLAFLLASNVYQIKQNEQHQEVNLKILSFTNVFIEKVLMASQDVDFDTRLTLETLVRNIDDEDIFTQWQKFTQAKDNQEASIEAKKLLNILVKKISY